MSNKLKLAIGSLLLGLVVLALKLLAWALTGSVALLSDALESTVNLATALAALIAIRVAAMPADTNHPFGHHKAEYFSAVLEGVLIIVAALLILREAWTGFWAPRPLDAPLLGLAVNIGATALNAAWAFV
ncbi:MAG: cation diffusion facilitator family transporter, partial [Sagittula sp.]